jgi:replicative DNA helicase
LVGAIYKQPDLLVEYGQYIKSKYDFNDDATRFFYDIAMILFETRTQTFNKTTLSTYMTEDKDRLLLYKQYGGWKTIEDWISLAIIEDVKNYFEVLKKYSLLREYQRNGYAVEKIVKHPKFETFTAADIYRLIRGKVDRIHTVILTNSESEILNSKISELVDNCMALPDMGLQMPFMTLNDLFRGMKRKSMMSVGMLSNAGKSRFMTKLIAYSTLVLKEKVLVLLNEMTLEEMRYALLTTVINNEEFQNLHGINLTKKEREITLGLYRDSNKKFIYRKRDDWGDFSETVEEYIARVEANSNEYKNIKKIAAWIEDETQGLIFAKDISSAYDDRTLEFEIRKANLVHGVNYVFYDTLKQDTGVMGDWSALKATTTKLSEFAKQLNIFIYGSIQLTDDANHIDPDELTSSQIANAKQLKHVLHTLVLFKEIDKTKYSKYRYLADNSDWGEPSLHELDSTKRYYLAKVDKNRFGRKSQLLFEVDLDLNTWVELGEVFKK